MSRRTEIGVGARGLALLFLVVPGLLQASGLDLPSRTVVVRDFARLRQDLLDTLRVNLPDATVDILQFRGADVVLSVGMRQTSLPEDQSEALAQLRRYCDRLIRSAAPGMRLAPGSTLVLEAATGSGADPDPKKDVLDRLRAALGGSQEASGATTGSPAVPEGPDLLQSGLKAYLSHATARIAQEAGQEPEDLVPSTAGEESDREERGRAFPIGAEARVTRSAPPPGLPESGTPRSGTEPSSRPSEDHPGRSSEDTVRELYRRIHEDLAVSRVHADLRSTLDRPPEPTTPPGKTAGRTLAAAPSASPARVNRSPNHGSDQRALPRQAGPSGNPGSLFDLFDSGSQSDLAEPPAFDGAASWGTGGP